MQPTYAIILAAGLGTRMRSPLPKVMHPILGRPMVAWVIDAAIAAGCDAAIAVIGYGRDQVASYLRETYPNFPITFAIQEPQLGTAHAVQQALPFTPHDGSIFILNGDIPNIPPTLLADLRSINQQDPALLSCISTLLANPNGYGRIVRDPLGNPLRIVEDRDCTPEQRLIQEINVGIYLVNAAFLHEHLSTIRSSNAQAEFYLTDLLQLAAQHHSLRVVIAEDSPSLLGVNDPSQLAEAASIRAARIDCEK